MAWTVSMPARLSIVALFAVPALPAAAGVTFFTWQGDDATSPSDYGTAENWDLGSVPGFEGLIFPGTAATFTVDLNGDRSLQQITFQGATGYTINGVADTLGIASGGIIVNASEATHKINSGVAISTAPWTVGDGSTLVVNGTVSENFSGRLLTKESAGTLTLNGANTYTGGTIVDGGTLLVNNTTGSATGTGTVFVDGSATLGGTGSIGGALTVDRNGTLAPGASTGRLTVNNTVQFDPEAAFTVELAGRGGVPGTDFDRLDTTGAATLGGTLSVSRLNGFTPRTADTFAVLTSPNVTGTFANAPDGGRVRDADGGSFRVSYTPTAINTVELRDFVQTQTDVLVLSGTAAPDGNGTLSSFERAALNDAGQVAFQATLAGTTGGVSDDEGLFRAGAGGLVQVVREGQATPDGNNFIFGISSFSKVLNGAGQVAFTANLTDTQGQFDPAANTGIYRGDGTTLTRIAEAGDPVPGGDGVFGNPFDAFRAPGVNDGGAVDFVGNIVGASGGDGTSQGLYRDTGTTLTQLVRRGDAAHDGNGTFDELDLTGLDNTGRAVFFASLSGTAGGAADNSGLFRHDGTTLTQLVRAGDAAPGGNGTFSFINEFAANGAGQVSFAADLTGTTGGTADDRGIFRTDGTPGGLVQIVREGDAAPGGDGVFSSVNMGGSQINDAGQVLFNSNLTGASGGAVGGFYISDGTTTTPIFRFGEPASDGNGTYFFFNAAAFNNAGQAAFSLGYTGTSGGGSDDRGILFYDEGLGLITVAREGDALLGSTITGLGLANGEVVDGQDRDGLNDLGQVAYAFNLADGRSGVALWSFETIAGIIGDYNDSGLVEQGDLNLVLNNWGAAASPTPTGWINDLPTGIVDQAELNKVLNNWGSTAAPDFRGTGVPEPRTAWALALTALFSRRRCYPCKVASQRRRRV